MVGSIYAAQTYRVGQRVAVYDVGARRWRAGSVAATSLGLVAVQYAHRPGQVEHMPASIRWVRPVYVVEARPC